MDYDLIVIGSGSVGSATGYYASKSGLKVLMIDSGTPPHQNGSHHGSTRITRCAYGEGAIYIPLCLRARELWNELEVVSGQKLVVECGVLNAGPEDCEFIKNVKITCEQYNLNVEYLNFVEVNKRWSGITIPADYVGVFEKDAGYLMSELSIGSFVNLSKKAGAKQLFNCVVKSVNPIEHGVKVVTDKGIFLSKKAVVSTGTWVKNLLPKLPVTPVRKVFTVNKMEGNLIPAAIIMMKNEGYYTIPDKDGYKIGQHDGGQVIKNVTELVPFGTLEVNSTGSADFIKQVFPDVGDIIRGVVCTYDVTPDENFIIDTLPESDNILIITGLSGHGFKFSTVLGEIGACFGCGVKPSVDITPFSLSRFNKISSQL